MIEQRIIPHLWFNDQALEAVRFYTRVFEDSAIIQVTKLEDTPSGDCDLVVFALSGFQFMAINGGPYFKPNPSISFFVNFDPISDPQAKEHLDELWDKLSEGGIILMQLDEYPFSSRYGWVQDAYGVSWQLILTKEDGDPRPKIIPSLMFTDKVNGKAEEACLFYQSVFKQSRMGEIARYPGGMEPNLEGNAMFLDFMLEGQWFAAMDSAYEHPFSFNEGISLMIECESQAEIDYYWQNLCSDAEAGQCGWLKDRYGLSWQVAARKTDEMLFAGTQPQRNRMSTALLQMRKIDIAELEKAFANQV